jgi:hypothetical protein
VYGVDYELVSCGVLKVLTTSARKIMPPTSTHSFAGKFRTPKEFTQQSFIRTVAGGDAIVKSATCFIAEMKALTGLGSRLDQLFSLICKSLYQQLRDTPGKLAFVLMINEYFCCRKLTYDQPDEHRSQFAVLPDAVCNVFGLLVHRQLPKYTFAFLQVMPENKENQFVLKLEHRPQRVVHEIRRTVSSCAACRYSYFGAYV